MAEVLPSDELIEVPSDYGSLRPGTRLGRYELLVPIARGGMARVWASRLHGQRGFQKLVAIKTILPHLAEEPQFERMFLDEARIASGVHHPNVCEIYELGEEQHTLYLVMEWVNGDSLSRVLRSSGKTEPVDSRVGARIIADACAGLHAAHELTDDEGRSLGVVHRDLSPHNILLTADGTAKVADFGVAKALGQLHEATSAGQLKGKIAYMAPEQVTGNAIDRRSDVFSLGCVLYEATTGQRPFRGDGDHQVMHAVLKGEVAPPTSLIRQYPQELERIVMRALSPQPILRYPTAERMRFALEEFLARGPLVTQSNVAQVVRARIGELIERRKERIRQASSAGDREAGWSEPPGGMTPSNQAHDPGGGHWSGVKPSGAHAARPVSGIPHPGAPSAMPLAQTSLMPPTPSAPPVWGEPHWQPQPQHHPPPQPQHYAQHHPSQQPARDERPSTPPAGAGSYFLAIALGLLLAGLIGVGAFFALRHRRHPPPGAEPVAVAAETKGASATGGAASAGAPSPVSGEITFRIDPPEATLSVDGQELAGAGRAVPRPAMGKSVMVVARAKDHEDVTILVDFFSTSPMELTLKPVSAAPQPAVDPVPSPSPAAVAAPDEAAKEKDPPRDPPKKDVRRQAPRNDPALPPNPF